MPPELFDPDYYLAQIGQQLSALDAWRHFEDQGDAAGLDPSPYFSTRFYKARYPNWYMSAATAFGDFLFQVAKRQSRQPHPLIDPEKYTGSYADLADLGALAALHFIRHGDGEGRSPSPEFNADFYRRAYLELGASHPFRHYVVTGAARGYLPRPLPRDADASRRAIHAATAGLARPFVLVSHDAQRAGVPILTLDLARALRHRGMDPVFLLGNAGPLLDAFRSLGPTFILAEGWDIGGLASGLAPGTAALINSSAAAAVTLPLARAGLDCVQMIHEMPDYIRDQGLLADLRAAQAAGARLVVSMPQMARALAPHLNTDSAALRQVLPGIVLPATTLTAFRQARRGRLAAPGPVCIGAGHADRRKGFDLFLEAAHRIAAMRPDARFIWLGALDPWAQGLADQARAKGLELSLPGFVTDSPAWYRAADVYLLTSRQDPGPTTAIHAAAVGTPFVGYAADIGLVGLTEGIGQFVAPGDVPGFVAAAIAQARQVTPASRRALRRLVKRQTGFDRYVTALLDQFPRAADGAA